MNPLEAPNGAANRNQANAEASSIRRRNEVAVATIDRIEFTKAHASDADAAIKGRRPVFLDVTRGFEDTAIYDYALLHAGHTFEGPAVIEVPTTTVSGPRAYPERFTTS